MAVTRSRSPSRWWRTSSATSSRPIRSLTRQMRALIEPRADYNVADPAYEE